MNKINNIILDNQNFSEEENVTTISYINKRTYQEDRYILFENDEFVYSGIFDGHGGYLISEYLKQNFHKQIYDIITIYKEGVKKHHFKNSTDIIQFKTLIEDIYIETDNILKQIQSSKDIGSTAIIYIFLKKYRDNIIINLGDSRLINYSDKKVYITKDHKPEDKKESQRIEQTTFIENNRISGNINISRTFGDFRYKPFSEVYKNPIMCIPNIKIIRKTNNCFTLLASDGLFDVISNNKIIYYLLLMIANDVPKELIIKNLMIYASYFNDSRDNITISLFTYPNNKKIIISNRESLILKFKNIKKTIQMIHKKINTKNIRYYDEKYKSIISPLSFGLFSNLG